MRYLLTASGLFLCSSFYLPLTALGASSLSFDGLSLPAVDVSVPSSTGLDKVYVCYDTEGAKAKFRTSNPQAKWYRFANLGGGYAEEITVGIEYERGYSILNNPAADMGYIIEDGDQRAYFWIVQYKGKRLTLDSASAAQNQECDASVISVNGEGEALHYYTINGQQRVVSRDIEVRYNTLSFDNSAMQYIQGEVVKTLEYLTPEIRLVPPAYCQTQFHIFGDRFLKVWNWEEEIVTDAISPHAIAFVTTAEQDGQSFSGTGSGDGNESRSEGDEDSNEETGNNGSNDKEEVGSNVIKTETTGLGGSAPVDVNFRAYVTDGVLHNEWQLSMDPYFETVEYRFNQQDVDYTFLDEGTYYVRFVGSNFDGSCEQYGDTYTITIGGSELRIPNAFSPNGDGINDEWKVAYRSLLKFECWIFDRYGKEICHLTSPDQGWDGKIKGKYAKPGVYYYVIEAQGADGKKYKKGGDINIINFIGGNKTESPEM